MYTRLGRNGPSSGVTSPQPESSDKQPKSLQLQPTSSLQVTRNSDNILSSHSHLRQFSKHHKNRHCITYRLSKTPFPHAFLTRSTNKMAKRSRIEENEDTATTSTTTTRRRRRESTQPFASLKPRTQNVSKRTIKTKWSNLPDAAQEKVRAMFRTLERPVIVLQRDERKRVEAQTALGAVVKT